LHTSTIAEHAAYTESERECQLQAADIPYYHLWTKAGTLALLALQ
jgi:hypothetical protein